MKSIRGALFWATAFLITAGCTDGGFTSKISLSVPAQVQNTETIQPGPVVPTEPATPNPTPAPATGRSDGSSGGSATVKSSIHVLYVGNSLLGFSTSKGDTTPDLIEKIAKSQDKEVVSEKVFNFGKCLYDSWVGTNAPQLLDGSTKYDFIVLNDCDWETETLFLSIIPKYYLSALKNSLAPNGKVLLFENWGYSDLTTVLYGTNNGAPPDPANVVQFPSNFSTRADYLTYLKKNYEDLHALLKSDDLPNWIIPNLGVFNTAQAAGWDLLNQNSGNPYLMLDTFHPSDQGRYMSALTIYSMMFQVSPVGLTSLYFGDTSAMQRFVKSGLDAQVQ